MKLSDNFSLNELIKSQTAERKRIDNTPGIKEIENLKSLCINVLEKIRKHFGKPVIINSGYRGAKLNAEIGGSKNSQHLTGEAADIEINGIDNLQLVHWISENLEFDQLISEFYVEGVPDSGWVHVSWSTSDNRKQRLTINKLGTKVGLPLLRKKEVMKITKISLNGINLLKKFEGLKLKSYLCSAGVPTIGYGSTYYEDGTKVKLTDPQITEDRAVKLLLNVLQTYEKAVDSFCRDDITQNQFDALVCFAYNVGINALKNSTLLKMVNENPKNPEIKTQFLRWNKAAGKAVKGLTIRREEEAKLYFT